jgi:hypothetical protein
MTFEGKRKSARRSAGAFLSGLTDTDLGVVKQRIEARANPEIAEARAATLHKGLLLF